MYPSVKVKKSESLKDLLEYGNDESLKVGFLFITNEIRERFACDRRVKYQNRLSLAVPDLIALVEDCYEGKNPMQFIALFK